MVIKLANDTSFEYLSCIDDEEFYNGSSRRTLTFKCEVGVISVDELNAILLNEDNSKTIELTGDPEAQYDDNGEFLGYHIPKSIHDGYVLKLDVGIKPVLVTPESPEAPAVYKDRLVFKLGRRTFLEQAIKDLGIK